MFEFDNNGFLKPYRINKCSENQFRDFFINRMAGLTSTREKRWNEYCDFIAFVKKHPLQKSFKVWVFGSIVGNYKEPDDVDVVLFLHYSDWINFNTAHVSDYIECNAKMIFNVQCDHVFRIPQNRLDILELNAVKKKLVTKERTKGAVEIIY